MAELLIEAKQTIAAARTRGRDGLPWGVLSDLRSHYDALIAQGWAANPDPPAGRRRSRRQREPVNLLTRLEQQDFEVQASWVDFAVPFDNNAAERDLRMTKLQQKISGCFRSEAGADAFCAVRSYLHTAAKHGIDLHAVLVERFTTGPWIPSPTPAT